MALQHLAGRRRGLPGIWQPVQGCRLHQKGRLHQKLHRL